MTDLFSEIRERLTMEEVAERYGFEPNRQHKICCPFHNDSHPSLQLYKGGKGWWCYVCDTGGSVLDFTAKLFNLSVREAAEKLSNDFNLGLTDKTTSRNEAIYQNHQRFLRERKKREKHRIYDEHQKQFIELRRKLFNLGYGQGPVPIEYGGRIGQIKGKLFLLEEWFFENPWE